jgi:hypothetical protein
MGAFGSRLARGTWPEKRTPAASVKETRILDVHAPMEPIHSWRDIALHLGIITIGLLIALSLEGLVEYVHHRHLVAEARTNIRQELEGDHQAAQKDLGLVQKNIETLQANIVAIHSL